MRRLSGLLRAWIVDLLLLITTHYHISFELYSFAFLAASHYVFRIAPNHLNVRLGQHQDPPAHFTRRPDFNQHALVKLDRRNGNILKGFNLIEPITQRQVGLPRASLLLSLWQRKLLVQVGRLKLVRRSIFFA